MTKAQPLSELSAEALMKLIRVPSGHPDQHGFPYTRTAVIREMQRRGKSLLEELDWPTSLDATYWQRRCGKQDTLENICKAWRFAEFSRILWECEEALNKLTKGEFYGDFAGVGIECSTVTEWRVLLKKYPEAEAPLREAVRLHKGFYEQHAVKVAPISEIAKSGSDAEKNIEKLSRWLGLDVNKIEPVETLPEISIYYGVWTLVENYSPTPPKPSQVRGQTPLDIFTHEG